MTQSYALLFLAAFAYAPTMGCSSTSSSQPWTPLVPGDESQAAESDASQGADSSTTPEDDSSSADSTPGLDSTVDSDSSTEDTSSEPDDGSASDGAVPDDTGAAADTGVFDDSASTDGAGDAEGGPDASSNGGEGGSDASDAGSDASEAGSDASDAGSDAKEGGSDASDAGVDAAQCTANILTPSVAVASSTFALLPAGNAIDGNFTTRWDSVHGVDPQWIYVDFGAPVFISRVQIAWETDCAKNYDLQVSNDSVAWTTMTSIAGNIIGGPAPVDWTTAANHPVLSGVGRYLRINGTVRCTANGYSIWEMRVFGDTNATCHP